MRTGQEKRLFFCAGEISGDTHAAQVMRELLARGDWSFEGLGGPEMSDLAPDVEDWLENAAVLGLAEVLAKYGFFRQKMAAAVSHILGEKPDGVVLVDYPGFNLTLAKRLRRGGYAGKLIYFISPQVWAWKRGRIRTMAKLLDLMLCIFPFEEELYTASGLQTQYVGHPLPDALATIKARNIPREKDLIALLPGSREREVSTLFPEMLAAAKLMLQSNPVLRFATAGATPSLTEKLREMVLAAGLEDSFEVGQNSAREIMCRASLGVVASGTATLEAACLGLPYCLVYKVNWITATVARWVMSVRYLGIVNVIADREVVRELLQEKVCGETIAAELNQLLADPEARLHLQSDLAEVVEKLGGGGMYHRTANALASVWNLEDGRDL